MSILSYLFLSYLLNRVLSWFFAKWLRRYVDMWKKSTIELVMKKGETIKMSDKPDGKENEDRRRFHRVTVGEVVDPSCRPMLFGKQ